MDCKKYKEKLNFYLDEFLSPLSPKEKKEMETHLLKCKTCAQELEQLKEIGSLLKEIPVPLRRNVGDLCAETIEQLDLCPEVSKRLSLAIDTPEIITANIEKHLKICSRCSRELADLRMIHRLVREIPVPEAAVDLSQRIEENLPTETIVSRKPTWEHLASLKRFAKASLLPWPGRPSQPRKEYLLRGLRWAVLTGAAATFVFLIVRFYTPTKKISTLPSIPQPVVVEQPVSKPALEPQPWPGRPIPEIAKKEEISPSEKIVKKIVPAPETVIETGEHLTSEHLTSEHLKVELPKLKFLHFLNETKPQTENIIPTTLSREASFTTLSFLPTEENGLPTPKEQIYVSLYNGNSLWLGLFTAPAKIVKIGVEQSQAYTVYTCAVGDDNATSMVYAQGSLWVGLDSIPLKILKVNPVDGSYQSYLVEETKFADDSGGIRNAATFDGKYLWFGLWTKPAKLVRINPEDLSYDIYTCKTGEDNPSFALYDGKNVWFGLYTQPAKYLKVNSADGSYLAYALKEGENYIKTGVYDGKNVWFGLETKPGKLVKVNPQDGTYFAYNLREGENMVTAGTFAQRYLWFSIASEPTKILQVNPYTGNYIAYTRGEIKNISAVSFDGKNLWFATSAAKLLKVSL